MVSGLGVYAVKTRRLNQKAKNEDVVNYTTTQQQGD